jgi:hypothetical protein
MHECKFAIRKIRIEYGIARNLAGIEVGGWASTSENKIIIGRI